MCGSMQKAAAKALRKWMVDHGIPAEIIAMLLGPELPDDDKYQPAPRKNLIRNAMMVAYHMTGGLPTAELMRWGMLPKWKQEAGDTMPVINARSETVFTARTFKNAVRERRCVVPCGGFFEPRVEGSQAEHARYLFTPQQADVFAIAAIWNASLSDEAKESCILTTEPNAVVAPIHDRMPVILDEHGIKVWCDPDSSEAELQAQLQPCPPEWLTATPVLKPPTKRKAKKPKAESDED